MRSCRQILASGAGILSAKKESAARTLNFSDLKCPEGSCNVPVICKLHHSGKRRARSARRTAPNKADEKKARRSGLNNQLKKALYSRAGTVYESALPRRIRGIPLRTPVSGRGAFQVPPALPSGKHAQFRNSDLEQRLGNATEQGLPAACITPPGARRLASANAPGPLRTAHPHPRAYAPHSSALHPTARGASPARRQHHGAGRAYAA